MRLARVGAPGHEVPVVAGDAGELFDLRPVADDIGPAFFAADGMSRARNAFEEGQLPRLDPGQDLRFGSPISRPHKVLCIGLNYTDHAEESGMPVPAEPVLFAKMTNTVVGPDDTVLVPRGSTRTDYEVELGVVIGSPARYLGSEQEALDAVAGYAVSHDVSERTFQIERGGQWVKGKSCETFNPLGPWLVPEGDVEDRQNLGLRLWVNGEERQNGTTRDMVFGVAHLVWYLSQFLVLEPGDVINTGTPAGVAHGNDEIPYLSAGDIVELEIDGLGRQRQVLEQA